MGNTLYYGDNLDILRNYIKNESLDLIYLDPPFNSKRDYNVLFTNPNGTDSTSQMHAFEDTWNWGDQAEKTFLEIQQNCSSKLIEMLTSFIDFIGRNDITAYLTMMAIRLEELHRVLKSTGSLYLHCDPTASHYLKILLDIIFHGNFRNEIIWRRTGSHNKVGRYAPIHDVIFFYTKTNNFIWNNPKRPYMKGHIEDYFIKDEKGYRTNYYGNVLTGSGTRGGESGKPWRGIDPTPKGRHWAIPGALLQDIDEDISDLSQHEKLDYLYEKGFITFHEGNTWPIYGRYLNDNDGQPISDIWAYQPYTENTIFGTDKSIDQDVRWLSPKDQERLGYQTQKPLGLLDRIIKASSNVGDIVLDPFCGCGTTIDSAEKLERKWIGIDITTIATGLIKFRLNNKYHLSEDVDYEVIGEPKDLEGARELANKADKYQFQWWAVNLVKARPYSGKKKGADEGVDGVIYFQDWEKVTDIKSIVIQVKSGKNISVKDIRELNTIVENKKAAIGVYITLEKPKSTMIKEAISKGFYNHKLTGRKFFKIQILSIEDIFNGKKIDCPLTIAHAIEANSVGDTHKQKNWIKED